jgi:hypothetical protein
VKSKAAASFTVTVGDNFHYRDKSAWYDSGSFRSLVEAEDAAKKIVNDYLESAYEQDMSATALYLSYTCFGVDPFIVGSPFSAWDYAKQRCDEMCTTSNVIQPEGHT